MGRTKAAEHVRKAIAPDAASGVSSSVPRPSTSRRGKYYGVYAPSGGGGVYASWSEAKDYVQEVRGSRVKRFATKGGAKRFSTTGDYDTTEDSPPPPCSKKRTASSGNKVTSDITGDKAVKRSSQSLPSSLVLDVYTDGSCFNNGRKDPKAGVGVFWGTDDPRNVSVPLRSLHAGPATNNRAELAALLAAYIRIRKDEIRPPQVVRLHTDSHYCIKCLQVYARRWDRNGWKTATGKRVLNQDILKPLLKLYRGMTHVQIYHVRGHSGDPGNEAADKLARQGSEMERNAVTSTK
jgi:ribonuclease HI